MLVQSNFEDARILLGPFPKTNLMETERFKIVTVKKVSTCYYCIIDKQQDKKHIYKKVTTFEKALKKHSINKENLIVNINEKISELIDSLSSCDLSKDDVDFFSIKKTLFKPYQEVVIGKTDVRSLIIKGDETSNRYELLCYIIRKNRKILTARVEIGSTEIFKIARRENIPVEDIVKTLQDMLKEQFEAIK